MLVSEGHSATGNHVDVTHIANWGNGDLAVAEYHVHGFTMSGICAEVRVL